MLRMLIVVGKFNELITKALLGGALEQFAEAGLGKDQIDVIWVPGSFDVPVIASRAAKSSVYQAVVCLGAVIKGETAHFDFVAGNAAEGLMQISVETGVPIVFGILTTDTAEQALARCGLKGGHKGRESADTALAMVKAVQKLKELERK